MSSIDAGSPGSPKLVVAIASRALFDFEEENKVFEAEPDDRAYMRLQLERLEVPAPRGVAFHLVQKLLALNGERDERVRVVILSRNDPVSGLRVFRSAESAGLRVERGVFTRGRSPYHYLDPLGAGLFLSASEQDVRGALSAGCPAARVYPKTLAASDRHPSEVRIAFDGDAVLFSDEAERVYQVGGIDAFRKHESTHVTEPLPPGPFKSFLETLHSLQHGAGTTMRVRTALVTARSAPAHERAIRTLMAWNIAVDEAMFLGGMDKAPFLEKFEPDFFFDDQTRYCDTAALVAPTGHVAAGVVNQVERNPESERNPPRRPT
jgi:5'-nucleotidase